MAGLFWTISPAVSILAGKRINNNNFMKGKELERGKK